MHLEHLSLLSLSAEPTLAWPPSDSLRRKEQRWAGEIERRHAVLRVEMDQTLSPDTAAEPISNGAMLLAAYSPEGRGAVSPKTLRLGLRKLETLVCQASGLLYRRARVAPRPRRTRRPRDRFSPRPCRRSSSTRSSKRWTMQRATDSRTKPRSQRARTCRSGEKRCVRVSLLLPPPNSFEPW